MIFFLYAVAGFLLGSIPFGWVVGKVWLGTDVRTQGSGNIGMTNVMRIGGRGPGVLTFLLDFGKGWLAVKLAGFCSVSFSEDPETQTLLITLIGCAAVIGHVFSVFFKLRGGKGVSTLFGILAAVNLSIFLLAAAVWIGMFVWKRISSLSALIMLGLLPWLFLIVPWLTQITASWNQFFVMFGIFVILIINWVPIPKYRFRKTFDSTDFLNHRFLMKQGLMELSPKGSGMNYGGTPQISVVENGVIEDRTLQRHFVHTGIFKMSFR